MPTLDYEISILPLIDLIREKNPDDRHAELLVQQGLRSLKDHALIDFDSSSSRSLRSVGRIRIASSGDSTAVVSSFLASLPALFLLLQEEWTTAALLSMFNALCGILLNVLKKSVVIQDPMEWKILSYLSFSKDRGHFPTAVEIAEALEADPQTVENLLVLLEKGKETPLGNPVSLVSSLTLKNESHYRPLV